MKKISLIVAALFFVAFANAQISGSTLNQPEKVPLELPWEQEEVGSFTDPVPYVFQRGNDVLKSYTIWRRIDLREKMNHPLYFPKETRGTWRSLGQVIFDAVDFNNPNNTESLPVYADEFCKIPKSKSEIAENLYVSLIVPDVDTLTGEIVGDKTIKEEFTASQILCFEVIEVWFFDKQRSTLDVRILKINPMIEYERASSSNAGDDDDVVAPTQLRYFGYINYDELRPYLAKQEVYNLQNNSQRMSLDDLLTWKRMFSSYVVAENNVYQDRFLSEFIANPRDQMIESQKITDKIRVMEHDLWEF